MTKKLLLLVLYFGILSFIAKEELLVIKQEIPIYNDIYLQDLNKEAFLDSYYCEQESIQDLYIKMG